MKVRRTIALALAMLFFAAFAAEPVSAEKIKGKTGIGMAEWAFKAYNEGWTYKWGGSSAGKTDCSGLIRSYCNGKGGGAKALLDASSVNGSANDMPRIHGLGLWCEGHAGVYVGKNKDGVDMAIDMRNSRVNVVYSAMKTRYYSPWKKWFKISMISYPDTGWFEFRGDTYYYKNGEFVVGKVTIDGKTYDFGKSGALKGEVKSEPTTTTSKKKTTTTTTTTTTITTTTTTTAATTTATEAPQTTTAQITTTTVPTTTEAPVTTTEYTEPETTTTVRSITSTRKTTSEKTTTVTQTTTTKKKTTTSKTTKQQKTTTTEKKTTTSKTTKKQEKATTKKTAKTTTLGYYDQDITEYYGPFTRDAIKAFQKALGVLPTGIADEATQKALFADDAPVYSEDNSLMNDDDYQIDETEREQTEETKQEEEVPVIADSVGISSLSMNANPYGFTRTYGESGPLQTMGVFSYKSPTVVFYRNGESYEVTEEMMETLDNCVFM